MNFNKAIMSLLYVLLAGIQKECVCCEQHNRVVSVYFLAFLTVIFWFVAFGYCARFFHFQKVAGRSLTADLLELSTFIYN